MIPRHGPERDEYERRLKAANAWFEGAAASGTCPICGNKLTVRRARDVMHASAAAKIGPDRPAYSCNGPGDPPTWTGLAEHHRATGNHFAFIGGSPT